MPSPFTSTTNSAKKLPCARCGEPLLNDDVNDRPFHGRLFDHCKNCGYGVVHKKWRKSKAWEDLIQHNFDFLCGKDFCTPGHAGPICEETYQMLPGLKLLHEYGIITHNSQPFENSIEKLKNGNWCANRQRATLEFTIPTMHPRISRDKLLNLVKQLHALDTIDMTVHSVRHTYSTTALHKLAPTPDYDAILPKAMKGGKLDHNNIDKIYGHRSNARFEHYDLTVTKYRIAKTQQELVATPWDHYTSMAYRSSRNCSRGDFDSETEFGGLSPIIKNSMPLYFEVAVRGWEGNVNLLGLVQEECEKAGLGRIRSSEQ